VPEKVPKKNTVSIAVFDWKTVAQHIGQISVINEGTMLENAMSFSASEPAENRK